MLDIMSCVERDLLDLVLRTGYNVVQENGQRKLGPPPDWQGPPPARGCEVFVARIPRDLYEDELVPVLEAVGRLYQLRLMTTYRGKNRGYAFATFATRSQAADAVRRLHESEIRPGRRIAVRVSVDNRRLFIAGLPKVKTRAEVMAAMSDATEGVVGVKMRFCRHDRSLSRGYALVEYESHRAACVARRVLLPYSFRLWGRDINMDWAIPQREPGAAAAAAAAAVEEEVVEEEEDEVVEEEEEEVVEEEVEEAIEDEEEEVAAVPGLPQPECAVCGKVPHSLFVGWAARTQLWRAPRHSRPTPVGLDELPEAAVLSWETRLQALLRSAGVGHATFELHAHSEPGRPMGLLYKVSVPGMMREGSGFFPAVLSSSVEGAREVASELLHEILGDANPRAGPAPVATAPPGRPVRNLSAYPGDFPVPRQPVAARLPTSGTHP
ncbi:RNA-binding protein 47-like [Lethenteron reissneri]|uniref:RNA-binding protein 47-like n=1 Tax=Lethenteron reissneri TaxID=7753 RepID=UPI002AB7B2DD|nr:RNA-binding protein 47-like [Lethenteron reissneri]XP_061437618.1 RNA-binding protein 47-like [Lethenteron reissneri]